MKKANISYRIHYLCWHQEDAFEELCAMIRDIRPAEEYALFTDDNSSPFNVPEMMRRFEVMGKRIVRLRELGVSVGINMMNTFGHREENLAYTAEMKRHFTTYDGFVCPGIACPNDPEWYENYLKPVYQAAAELHPDFIWVDDDFRLSGHNRHREAGCFCPECRRERYEATGLPEDLEVLKSYFDCPDRKEARTRRQLMLNWNSRSLISGAKKIEGYIHSVDENIAISQMDCWSASWDGGDYQGLYEAWAGKNSAPVRWRPGGGNYRDAEPEAQIIKASCLGKESAHLPKSVEVLQGELESYNYQPLNKSIAFTAIEPQVFCAAGLTGVAYNLFADPAAEKLSSFIPLVKKLKTITPFLDRMVADNGRVTPIGINDCCMIHRERLKDHSDADSCWLKQDYQFPDMTFTDLLKIGLPQGFDFAGSRAYIMRGNIAQSLEHEQIMQVLSRGVYLDAAALDTLNKLGYGEYTGFELENCFEADTVERYAGHPLNSGFAGMLRNIRQTFWKDDAWSLKAASGAQIVSSLEDFCGKEVAPCASGCFVNSLGGRVFAAGYGAWRNIYNTSKVCQLKNIFNFLSKDTLPGWIDSAKRMAIWVRKLADGGSCEVFNAAMDAAENTVINLRTASERFTVYHVDGSSYELSAEKKDGVAQLVIPVLEPWEVIHITWQK